jgi:tight adherence protein C
MPELNLQLTLAAVFVSVALLIGSLTYVGLEHTSPVRRRIRGLQRATSPTTDPEAGPLKDSPAASPIVRRVTTFIPKSPKQMTRLQRRLAQAGLHKPRHLALYVLAEALVPIVGFAAFILTLGWSGLIFAILAAIVGYLLPGLVVEYYARQRQKEIRNGLPDALDLLIVSLEAGLAIDQAILKSAEELRIAYPALAEELHMITIECRAGKPRIEAFKNFAARTKVDDVRALVAMLVQTDRFGTSIADALRTYAEVSRTKRRQRAEERAAKIGVKLVFPLVFCLFPAFFVVTLGPGVIKFVNAFSSSGAIGGSSFLGGQR